MTKQPACILLFACFFIVNNGLTQGRNKTINDIPVYYQVQFNADQKRYEEFTLPYATSAGEAFNLWQAGKKGYLKNYNVDSLAQIFYAAKDQEISKRIEFTKLNPHSYISLYYFKQRLLVSTRIEPDSLLNIYSLLDQKLKITPLGKSILESIKRKQSLRLNHLMPQFSFKTNKQEIVSLSSFRGRKCVLLCFWASWCGPCLRNIPFLKLISNTYANKDLQIISVSIDKDVSSWLAALERYGLTWLQTCDVPDYMGNNKLRSLYQIEFIPQYFLIDKTGRLTYHNILSDDDDNHSVLYNILEKELN